MKSKRIAVIVVSSIVALIVVLFVLRFATRRGQTAASSIDEIQAAEGIPVDVQIVQTGTVSRYLEILGTVRGIEQVHITSSLAIDITEIAKRAGDPVKNGDVIIRLARDRHGKAYHQYAMAEQALENAKLDLQRIENLHKEGAVSGQSLEQARLAYHNAKAQFDQASSVVDLVSPIDGVVTMVSATVGSQAAPGVPLATVASIDRMRVRCNVGYQEVIQLEVGQKAYIGISKGTGRDNDTEDGIEGEVTRVSLSSDPDTKLFLVEVTVDNRDGTLRSGIIATASVLVNQRADVITIPTGALLHRNQKSYVYRVTSNHARMSEVTAGIASGGFVELLDGVAEGDTIVTRGQFRLNDNARIKIHGIERTN